MYRTFRSVRLVAAVATVLAAAPTLAAPSVVGLDRSAARVDRATAGALTAASNASPRAIVAGYLQAQGRGADVIASLQVTAASASPKGVTHVRMEQRIDGLAVYGAYARAAIGARGELLQVIDRLVDVSLVQPSRIDATQALDAAVTRLYANQALALHAAGTTGNVSSFAGGAFFYRNPTVTAVVLPLENRSLARGWLVETWIAKTNQLHHTVVDGEGRVLEVVSRTNTDSYRVFEEDPLKAGQTVVSGPAPVAQPYGATPSPLGWLGSATQTTINLTGNNVRAYLDTDANNAPDTGGSAVTDGNFLTAVDLTQQPSTTSNKAVAAQNLFYLNNRLHDTLYGHGFNEANGNFQVNNFGRGGAGNDPVNAEAQDGSGTDNANFSTPSDGSSPRMQMYVWNSNPSGRVTVNNAPYPLYPSAFGAALTTTGVSGPLAATANPAISPSDADGCSTLPAGSLTGKVAVIARGTCTFTTKVLNAQNAGARAVIITNNADGGAFGPGGSDRKVKIPSGMVSKADGDILRTQIASTALVQKISALQLDGDVDADIVMHEYGHGLTWRMIGSMSGPLAGAIGEGASDVVALLMNCGGSDPLPSATCDDVVGEYAYNNALGIRRYRYDGYPLRYADVTGAEVHNDGEIYAAAMWNVLKNYVGLGLKANDLLHDFVDGMNWTQAAPAFEDMRDGMLQSVGSTSARGCAIWKGFAAQGIGVGADGVVSRRGTVSITSSFAIPAACQAP